MDFPYYESTKILKRQIKKSFKKIITNSTLNNHLYTIKNSYFSVEDSLKHIKKLPANEFKQIRVFEIANMFYSINKNKTVIEKLMEYLENVSNSVNLYNDEIALLPEMFKCVLLLNIAKESENTEEQESINKISSCVESLQTLNNYIFEDLYEKLSKSETVLNKDKTYKNSDIKSKNRYRHRISELAKKYKTEETDVINEILNKSTRISHGKKGTLGYYLFKNKNRKTLYFTVLILLTLLTEVLLYSIIKKLFLIIVTLLPSYILSKQITDLIFSNFKAQYVTRFKADYLPKTLVTIITFIPNEKVIDELCDKCLKYMYSNKTEGLFFGFLADLPQSTSPLTPTDRSLAEYAELKVKELNNKYGNRFFCAIREKSLNNEDGLYKGRERKRGAVSDFLKAVENSTRENFIKLYGDVYNSKYFISLDSDTVPGINSLKELIAVLENPLHEPEINSSGTSVSNGYAIAVPRIETELESSTKNLFTKIFNGKSGSEIYSYPSFNVYQDIFENAIFAGKGAINISVFNKVLNKTLDTGYVLSHDIIEGLFLRTVYVSDVVFYDKSPINIFSYLNRMDRWIRGDWQNIRYLLPEIQIADENKIKNPFLLSDKFKIADNILRSLTFSSLFSLILFGILLNRPPLLFFAFLILFKDSIITLIKFCLHPISFIPLYYRSGDFTTIAKNFLYTFSTFLLLPSFAFCEIKAVIKAIYRQITKKKLLEWITSEQTDKKTSEKQKVLKNLPFQFSGIAFCLFPLGVPFAIFWILGLPYATVLSTAKVMTIQDNESNRTMRDIWRYFEDSLVEKYNFLPPDNYQENPMIGFAPRTSPTNIGLTLLTILGAYDMSFINEDRCLAMIENTLTSIESLEKYRGHLFNWYDITNKRPLYPKYISTVDNGNFVCCIYTLKNALKEFGQSKAKELEERLQKIIEETDFTLLFNQKRKLFHIGFDVENQELSKSFYDLYASESRLTSYYTIASGQIEHEHWSKLGRPLVIQDGTVGIKSWSGTMFEYLMPHLLLPVKESSLSDEMIRFTIRAQIKSTKKTTSTTKDTKTDIPWGISESCYFSLGTDLAYQYKAFGSEILAINESSSPDNEIIISPYSTFLSMPYAYRESVKNLNILSRYDSKGKYGYYESIEFRRSSDKYIPQTINTFMVHHMGMSFISLLNIKKDNIMKRRFMDKKMSAFSLLLDEVVPTVNHRSVEIKSFDKKTVEHENRTNVISEFDIENQQFSSYSDGKTNLILSNCGNGFLKFNNKDIIYADKIESNGVFAFFKYGKQIIPFSYAPLNDNSFNYKTVFNEGYAEYEVKAKSILLKQAVTVIQGKATELREISIKNNSTNDINGELLIYLEPILQDFKDYQMHPTFSKLFIEADFDKDDNTIYVARRNRNNGKIESVMSVYFDRNIKFNFELSRFNLIETNNGRKSVVNAFNSEFSNNTSGPVDPCIALKIKLYIKEKELLKLKMYTSFEDSKEKILKNKISILENSCQFNKYADETAYFSIKNKERYTLNNKDVKVAELMINAIHSKNKVNVTSMIPKNTLGVDNLWKFGISDNNPIITVKISENNYKNCDSYIKAFAFLKSKNISCNLVICFVENEGYDRKIRTKIIEIIMNTGIIDLIDKSNGIFIISLSNIEQYSLLNSVSVLTVDTTNDFKLKKHLSNQKKEVILDVEPVKMEYQYKTGIGGFTENGFTIDDKDKYLHKPPWSNVLANKYFGTLVSDSSLGFTYALNSYKNKLTTWENNITQDNNGESLFITINNGKEKRTYDIIKNSTVIFNDKYTEYISKAENILIKTKVFIPEKLKVKVIKITIENPNKESLKLKFTANIIMNDRKHGRTVSKTRVDDTLYFQNPFNTEFRFGTVFLKGINMKPEGEGLFAIIQGEQTSESIILFGYEKTALAAEKISDIMTKERILKEEKILLENSENNIEIQTPSNELNLFYNSFLKNQIINCRLYAKAGFHQCSGAYGFRDQIQDSLCIVTLDSHFLKHQILLCAQNQFEEGDVLHWFHEKDIKANLHKGVRSKSSDDLLWLPYAICEYAEKTQDYGFLNIKRHYIKHDKLKDNEKEKYVEAEVSDISDSIYKHGKRALLKASTKGKHGLVVFGSGDWNDGLNEIGSGETVWGTFFIIIVLERYAKLSNKLNDKEFELFCSESAQKYRKNLDVYAWDTDRFVRGFLEDGSKFGCKSSPECKIDLIAQSFAAICGGFDPEKTDTAIKSAEKFLVDKENRIIKLFDPPFNKSTENLGYIQGYLPGIRENGGQYTHASLWFVLALLKIGENNKAFEVLDMINPINHSKTLKDTKTYRNEPYVLSADIYTNPAHYGMGGWSWYTGSAGWFFKIVTEEILGLKQLGNRLFIEPKIPDNWNSFSVKIKKDGKTVSITVIRSADQSVSNKLIVDGKTMPSISLDGNDHNAIYYI